MLLPQRSWALRLRASCVCPLELGSRLTSRAVAGDHEDIWEVVLPEDPMTIAATRSRGVVHDTRLRCQSLALAYDVVLRGSNSDLM